MKHLLSILLALALCTLASAQKLKSEGANASEIIPNGWEIISESTGDLNKDGIADLAFIVRENEDSMIIKEEYRTINENAYTLAIYWGTPNGKFTHYKDWVGLFSAEGESESYEDLSVEITTRGTMKIHVHVFISAGSWTNPNFTVTYRYQNGDFYKIGYDSSEFHRGTGEGVSVSINYSTGKKYVEPFSMSDDKKQKGYWETLEGEEKKLKKLGEESW